MKPILLVCILLAGCAAHEQAENSVSSTPRAVTSVADEPFDRRIAPAASPDRELAEDRVFSTTGGATGPPMTARRSASLRMT